MNQPELAPQRLCESCAKTPHGVDGHEALERFDGPIRRDTGHAAFECRECGAVWFRSYAGEGRFAWKIERLQPASDKG